MRALPSTRNSHSYDRLVLRMMPHGLSSRHAVTVLFVPSEGLGNHYSRPGSGGGSIFYDSSRYKY